MLVSTSNLKSAIERPKSNDKDIVKQLAELNPLEYDRVRKERAKDLGVRPETLDKQIREARLSKHDENSNFSDIEPWHEPINPTELLDEITSTIQRFIILDNHQAQTAALWVCATWFIDEIHCAPILLINAPERACGKTQLLSVLSKLAPRATQASSITPSVLFRMIEAYKPTLFIDEIETVLHENEELRGLINAGHTRDSAFVWRSAAKGDDFEPKRYTVWGMKAIAGINAVKLAETVTSRSIVIELRRKKTDETVQRLRHAEPDLFAILAAKVARFSEDYHQAIKAAKPELPFDLSDREQDNWEPLFQIASVAGEHWTEVTLNAALKIKNTNQEPQSSSNELLEDIKEIFDTKSVIKISTTDLINSLCEDSEKSWGTYNRGKQLTPRQLSKKLKDYGISSKTIRIDSYETAKGYEAIQFQDAFERYLNDPKDITLQGNICQ